MSPNALTTTMFADLYAQLNAWKAVQASRSNALVGQPFIVYCDGGLALRIKGNAAIPTTVRPDRCGISHFDRKDAEHVAQLRGAPYRVVHIMDLPGIRIEELEGMLTALGCPAQA